MFFVSASAASVVMGRVVEGIGAHRGMRLAAAASAASLLGVALFAGSWMGLVIFLVLGGLATAVAHPATHLSLAREIPPGRQGYSFGVVVEAAGYGAAWLLSGALALAAVVAILVGRKLVLRGRAGGRGGGPAGRFTNLGEKG